MRKYALYGLLLMVTVIFTACGPKDASSIVKDLSERAEEMKSYSSHGKLTIKTDYQSQQYDIEVWYKKPNYYRVSLKNTQRGVNQIILKNDQGVYVLTPQLKKSFKFQSNWPSKNSQVYLYQTVISSIVDDGERKFKSGKNEYQFEVSANYAFNPSLKTQQIWLDDQLHPKRIHILNEKDEIIVSMEFDQFKESTSFDSDSFDMQYNLNSIKSKETFKSVQEKQNQQEVVAVTPGYIPQGSTLSEEREIQSVNGTAIVIRYLGKKPFTLTQRVKYTMPVSLPLSGEPINLGETVGVLSDEGKYKKLSWIQNGVSFEILGRLSQEEIIRVAASLNSQSEK